MMERGYKDRGFGDLRVCPDCGWHALMNHAERCNPVQGAMASELAAAVPEVRSTKLGYGDGHIVFNPIDPGDGFTINFEVAPKRRGRPYSLRDLHLLDQLSLEEAAELVRALVQWRTRMLAARKS